MTVALFVPFTHLTKQTSGKGDLTVEPDILCNEVLALSIFLCHEKSYSFKHSVSILPYF